MRQAMFSTAASAALGASLGFLGARVVFVNSAWSLLPWALAGIVIGSVAGSRRTGVAAGAAYGFALAYVFMVVSYDGTAALATRMLPFAFFGAFGAGCGAVLAVLGGALRRIRRT